MEVSNKNLGSPIKIWGPPTKIRVSNENIRVSNKNLGSPMKIWGFALQQNYGVSKMKIRDYVSVVTNLITNLWESPSKIWASPTK